MNALRHLWLLMLAAAPTAWSQDTAAPAVDPVIAHFREYRAALERNDLAAAETAAAAALAASETAQGRRTAVLALNLANLRLELDGTHDALTPARTAHTSATSAADSGVDPTAAALALGRAEIAAGDRAGMERLLAAFTAAEGAAALETDVYNAAVALGTWAIGAQEYVAARRAWATAARFAQTTEDPTFARARALTFEGAAIFLENSDRTLPAPNDSGIRRFAPADAQAANAAFAEAERLLTPVAFDNDAGPELTVGELAFAQAMAWRSALLAKVPSNDLEMPTAARVDAAQVASQRTRPRCALDTVRDTVPGYPAEALARYGVGAVVLHMRIDDSGTVVSRTIAAAIPPGVLADAVTAVADEWTVEKDPASPPDCEMPSSHYVTVRFVLD